MIAWLDLETSGLDERDGYIFEIAVVMTDDNLKETNRISRVVKPNLPLSDIKMDDVVREMHTRSGLFADLEKASVSESLATVETEMCSWFSQRCAVVKTLPLAGNTISFDRRWLRYLMPEFEAMFSHRSIDVSSITEVASRWNIPVYNNRPKKDKGVAHRALGDVYASIEMLAYYRDAGLVRESKSEAIHNFLDGLKESVAPKPANQFEKALLEATKSALSDTTSLSKRLEERAEASLRLQERTAAALEKLANCVSESGGTASLRTQ